MATIDEEIVMGMLKHLRDGCVNLANRGDLSESALQILLDRVEDYVSGKMPQSKLHVAVTRLADQAQEAAKAYAAERAEIEEQEDTVDEDRY